MPVPWYVTAPFRRRMLTAPREILIYIISPPQNQFLQSTKCLTWMSSTPPIALAKPPMGLIRYGGYRRNPQRLVGKRLFTSIEASGGGPLIIVDCLVDIEFSNRRLNIKFTSYFSAGWGNRMHQPYKATPGSQTLLKVTVTRPGNTCVGSQDENKIRSACKIVMQGSN